mgnify:FL=1
MTALELHQWLLSELKAEIKEEIRINNQILKRAEEVNTKALQAIAQAQKAMANS